MIQHICAVSVEIPIKILSKKSVNTVSGKTLVITSKQDNVKSVTMKKPSRLSTSMIGAIGFSKTMKKMNGHVLFVEKKSNYLKRKKKRKTIIMGLIPLKQLILAVYVEIHIQILKRKVVNMEIGNMLEVIPK